MAKHFWIYAILTVGSVSVIHAYGDHVCRENIQIPYEDYVRKTRVVPYTRRHWFYGLQTKYRSESYWTTETRYKNEIKEHCCNGYSGSIYNCQPICSNRCSGNRYCSAPNKCECNPGYGGQDCQPICDNCDKYEFCQSPGKCVCNRGYGRINGTGDCVPECTKGCLGNRYCSAPDKCECKAGYGGQDCQPICDNCDKFEFCQSPGKCVCIKGYGRINGTGDCVPECTKGCSEHSFCSEPEICQCEVGYAKSNDSDTCLAVCEPACGEYSSCQEPNLCTCNEGYKDMGNGQCQPVCNQTCDEHSHCTSPDKCECLKGYSNHEKNSTSCQPICTDGCPNHSTCLKPNSCECDSGYIKMGDICQPHCPNRCPDYAQCTAPNFCECFNGYEESEESHKCQPKCDQGCPLHSICTNPNTCRCKIGYLMSPNNTCDPQCSLHCLNGECSEPETCVCHDGYQLKENSLNICDPICKEDCINGECLWPDFCLCHVGYKPGNSSSCVPSCELECINSNCTEPDKCTCLEGFEMTETPNRCQPKCSQGCENGECIAPEVCQCSRGYNKIAEGCKLDTTTTDELTSTSTETEFDTSFSTSTSTETEFDSSFSTSTSTETVLATSLTDFFDLTSTIRPLNCTAECQCWSKGEKPGTLSTDKCVKICTNDQDKPCLNLAQCRCNQSNSSVICKKIEDDNISEINDIEFTCTIRLPRGESLKIGSDKKSISQYWLPILGILAGIIVISGIIGAVIYRNRKITYSIDPIYEDVLYTCKK